MNDLSKRWHALAPREQWLVYVVALAALAMLYLSFVGDPMSRRMAQLEAQRQAADTRALDAQNVIVELQARLAADPDLAAREALLVARAEHEALFQRIGRQTRELVSPAQMKVLLQDLLYEQSNLQLVVLDSFSEPLSVPSAAQASGEAPTEALPTLLYRHGIRLTLEGGYQDLLDYLQAIQASPWRLHWDRLDYQVGEAGPDAARIELQLHTLSRDAGWIGV